jgi:hypothetical protein
MVRGTLTGGSMDLPGRIGWRSDPTRRDEPGRDHQNRSGHFLPAPAQVVPALPQDKTVLSDTTQRTIMFRGTGLMRMHLARPAAVASRMCDLEISR